MIDDRDKGVLTLHRELFGEGVTLTYLKKDGVIKGAPAPQGATCMFCGTGQRWTEKYGKKQK